MQVNTTYSWKAGINKTGTEMLVFANEMVDLYFKNTRFEVASCLFRHMALSKTKEFIDCIGNGWRLPDYEELQTLSELSESERFELFDVFCEIELESGSFIHPLYLCNDNTAVCFEDYSMTSFELDCSDDDTLVSVLLVRGDYRKI